MSETDDSLKDSLNIKDELASLNDAKDKPSEDEEKFKKKLEDIQRLE